jgi:hypothetical protein
MEIEPEIVPDRQPIILVVGDRNSESKHYNKQLYIENLHYLSFAELTKCRLNIINPDVIVSALVGHTFDVIDTARLLKFLNFSGSYRACTNHIPRPDIICSEVFRVAPELDFGILPLDQLSVTDFERRHLALVA